MTVVIDTVHVGESWIRWAEDVAQLEEFTSHWVPSLAQPCWHMSIIPFGRGKYRDQEHKLIPTTQRIGGCLEIIVSTPQKTATRKPHNILGTFVISCQSYVHNYPWLHMVACVSWAAGWKCCLHYLLGQEYGVEPKHNSVMKQLTRMGSWELTGAYVNNYNNSDYLLSSLRISTLN